MPFIAKSERFKTLGKLAIAPSIFNINEPLVFGIPLMLNPIMLIPLVGSGLLNSILGLVFYNIGFFNSFNPTIQLPWVMPSFIGPFFTVGVLGGIAAIIAIAADPAIYYPFFKYLDNQAYKEEQGAA